MESAPPLYASAPPCASATTDPPLIIHPGLTWARRADGLDACKTLRLVGGAWDSTPAPPARGPEILRVAWHAPTPTRTPF